MSVDAVGIFMEVIAQINQIMPLYNGNSSQGICDLHCLKLNTVIPFKYLHQRFYSTNLSPPIDYYYPLFDLLMITT